jgi:hypothetical protein
MWIVETQYFASPAIQGGLQAWICTRETQSIASLQNFCICKCFIIKSNYRFWTVS